MSYALLIVQQSTESTVDELAARHNVSTKTVERILRGEVRSGETGIVPKADRRSNGRVVHPPHIQRLLQSGERMDLIAEHFGLDPSAPLRWGAYDGWDGLSHVATDGYVAWHSAELAALVRAQGGSELPTFGASRLMGRSIGARLIGGVEAAHETLARKHGLEIREAIGARRLAYLTKAKNRGSADDLSVVCAAVARLG